MASVGAGYVFGATETVTAAKLSTLLTSATVGSIVNADIDASAAIANSKLNLASISQAISLAGGLTLTTTGLTLTSVIAKMAKGADVASAAGNIALGDDGNYFDITGTNAITSITAKQAGTVVTLQFDSTASLVDGSNLKLQGNFTGAAEAQITLVSDGTNWFEVSRNTATYTPTAANALSGSVIQVVNTQSGAVSTGTTQLPYDDTIPQNTEGDEYITRAITPNNASNKLKIEVVFNGAGSAGYAKTAALFQDTTANALAAASFLETSANNEPYQIIFTHYMTAGTTSSTTFKVRAGMAGAGTITFNGTGGGRIHGGVMASSITITEIKA